MYKGVKQFTSNIFFNSSWALFSPVSSKDFIKKGQPAPSAEVVARDYHPFAYYGKSFSFEKSEQKVINNCRDWISKSFAKHPVLTERYITKLKDVQAKGAKMDTGRYYDFDLQVKILQLFKIDDYSSEIRVIDDSN